MPKTVNKTNSVYTSMERRLSIFLFVCLMLSVCVLSVSGAALAQDNVAETPAAAAQPRFFEARVRASDAGTLVAGKTPVKLWGVHDIEGMGATFRLAARNALDSVIAGQKVRCEYKSKDGNVITAQCTNGQDMDLGLYMLQQGYVVADRNTIFGTVFESPYTDAESTAQAKAVGVWAQEGSTKSEGDDGSLMFILGFVLFLCVLAAFSLLAVTIMRGFRRVVDAQNQNMDMIARERQLRTKEREIFATMLDAEIKGNKSKIEAYLVVYEEMLKALEDPERTPKYKNGGDIVQAQPALDRSVFDRNTDKLDILGNRLSSEVIHFYARIKTKPDYINLEPDMPIEEALSMVDKSIQSAKRLDELADRLIDLFSQGGHSSEDY